MANIAPSRVMVEPNFEEPGLLLQQNQVSGAFDLLAGENPLVKIGTNDLYVYIKRLEVRTRTTTGQSAANSLPSSTLNFSMISTPTYLLQTRAEYDHHDTAAVGEWGVGIVPAQRYAMRQGIFQQLRTLLLYGRFPSNGEGILNTNGATATSLPPDSNGNTTAGTYDNGQMAFYILSLITALEIRMYQLGATHRISIVGPQRVLGPWRRQDIVQLVQFQRVGGGTQSTAGLVDAVLKESGTAIDWGYDDTLQGKGSGGADAIVITAPELVKQPSAKIDTNEFANLSPNLAANVLMYMDMAAPREIPTPIAGGAIDVVSELRASTGWGIRPEAITIVSMFP